MGNIPAVKTASVDLTAVKALPEKDRTPFENRMLAAAQCNDNLLLEEVDLKKEGDCFTLTEQERSQALGSFHLLESYRYKLIESAIDRKIAELGSTWSVDDRKTLVSIIAQYARQVSGMSRMVDLLITAIGARKDLNTKGLLVFSLIWVILYNLGEAHKAWIADGNNPILPSNEMADFIANSLDRLSSGKIKMGIMSQDQIATGSVAMYHPLSDTLLLHPNLLRDPLHSPQPGETILVEMVPHELFHVDQDAKRATSTWSETEIEAYIFGVKAHMLVAGRDEVRTLAEKAFTTSRSQHSRDQLIMRAVKTSGIGNIWAKYLVGVLFEAGEDRLTVTWKMDILEIAEWELTNGQPNHPRRQEIVYKIRRTKFLTYISFVIADYDRFMRKKQSTLGADQFEAFINARYQSIKDPQEIKPWPNGTGVITALDYDRYVSDATNRLVLTYYKFGEERALQFFKEHFLPALFGDRIIKNTDLESAMDGLQNDP